MPMMSHGGGSDSPTRSQVDSCTRGTTRPLTIAYDSAMSADCSTRR